MRPTSFVPQELRLSSAQRAEDCRAMSTGFMSAEYASAESLPAPFNAAIDALEDLVRKVARRFHRAPSLTRRSVGAGLSAVRVLCAALVLQAALCFTAPPVTMPMGAVSSRGTMTMSLGRQRPRAGIRQPAGDVHGVLAGTVPCGVGHRLVAYDKCRPAKARSAVTESNLLLRAVRDPATAQGSGRRCGVRHGKDR